MLVSIVGRVRVHCFMKARITNDGEGAEFTVNEKLHKKPSMNALCTEVG